MYLYRLYTLFCLLIAVGFLYLSVQWWIVVTKLYVCSWSKWFKEKVHVLLEERKSFWLVKTIIEVCLGTLKLK